MMSSTYLKTQDEYFFSTIQSTVPAFWYTAIDPMAFVSPISSIISEEPRFDVDNNGIGKIDRRSFTIGQSTLIENL